MSQEEFTENLKRIYYKLCLVEQKITGVYEPITVQLGPVGPSALIAGASK